MKLYNRTTIPDEALEPLLARAGRSIGARTGGVIVIANRGRGTTASGLAHRCRATRPLLRRKRGTSHYVGLRWVSTDGGYFSIVLPHWTTDPLTSAESFFATAQHEWKHIKDFQDGARDWSRCGPGGRRPAWATRPEEQRAMAACEDAALLGKGSERAYEEVLGLAITLEVERDGQLAKIAQRGPQDPKRSCFSRCCTLARQVGAKITEYGTRHHDCRAEAPRGFCWAATKCHELVEDTMRRLLNNMGMGLEPCEPDCDCLGDEEAQP